MHPEVHDRVDPHGDVVAGDALLGRNGQRDQLHVDLTQPIHQRHDRREPGRTRRLLHPSQPEHDPLLELTDDPRGQREPHDNGAQNQQREHDKQCEHADLHSQRYYERMALETASTTSPGSAGSDWSGSGAAARAAPEPRCAQNRRKEQTTVMRSATGGPASQVGRLDWNSLNSTTAGSGFSIPSATCSKITNASSSASRQEAYRTPSGCASSIAENIVVTA